jgi:hypothetical protein
MRSSNKENNLDVRLPEAEHYLIYSRENLFSNGVLELIKYL